MPAAILGIGIVAWTVLVAHDRNSRGMLPTAVPAALTAIALILAALLTRARREGWAFAATGLGAIGFVATIFTGLYPRVLILDPTFANSLTISNAATGHYALQVITVVSRGDLHPAHRAVPELDLLRVPPATGRRATTRWTCSRPSGRWVISSTERSPAAAKTSSISSRAVASSRCAVGSSRNQDGGAREQHARHGEALPLPARTAARRPRRRRSRGRQVGTSAQSSSPAARSAPRISSSVASGRASRTSRAMLVLKMWASWAGDGDQAPHILLAVGAQVVPAQRHPAGLGIEEAQQEVDDGRLAGAARADQRHSGARLEPQVETVQHCAGARRVADPDALERELGDARGRREGDGGVAHGREARR